MIIREIQQGYLKLIAFMPLPFFQQHSFTLVENAIELWVKTCNSIQATQAAETPHTETYCSLVKKAEILSAEQLHYFLKLQYCCSVDMISAQTKPRMTGLKLSYVTPHEMPTYQQAKQILEIVLMKLGYPKDA